MKNQEIYQYALNLNKAFSNKELNLPAKVNFCIQKNMRVLLELAQEIDRAREDVLKKYGQSQENGTYSISTENVEVVSQELNELFSIDQEISILKFNIDNLGNINLSLEQMEALMFMIEEA